MFSSNIISQHFELVSSYKNNNVIWNSFQENDILQDIKDEDLPKLRDMFKKNWPEYMDNYINIDNFIKWKKINSNTKVQIMCPEGRWDDGTYIVIASEGSYNVTFFTMENSCERLIKGLTQTQRIRWDKGPLIYPFREKFAKALIPVLTSIEQPVQKIQEFGVWYIPREIALSFNIKCPDDCYLAPLRPCDAKKINENWDYSSPGSEQYIYNFLKMNGGIGLFSKSDDELRANALLTDVGSIGIVRTAHNFRNRGYGKLILQAMSKHRAQEIEPIAYTARDNTIMNSLLKSLGFICLNECRLVQFESKVQRLF